MNDDAKLSQTYGAERGGHIRKRLDDLAAAASLEDMKSLPGRCEELTSNRKGQFSVRLTGNYRLIFEPNHDPVPVQVSGGLDWSQITSVKVIEVVDYH